MVTDFNLIDHPWIPVVDVGLVSLQQLFTLPNLRALGGTPLEKIALLKLFQAIAQAAYTPQTQTHWKQLGWQGLAQHCNDYLQRWHNRFYLYDPHYPFLQLPTIACAEIKSFGTCQPEIATGNTSVLTAIQWERVLSDAEKALLLLTLMGCALGGKKTDNSVILSEDYRGKCNEKGKPSTAKPGSAIGQRGLLHSFCYGEDLQQTIWLNLFTEDEIAEAKIYAQGVGQAPWENMPQGENCGIAQSLQQSLMGRLIPLGRFCLLTKQGLHYSEGITHFNYPQGIYDPSITLMRGKGGKVTPLWSDPDKRPWRELAALLNFMSTRQQTAPQCWQLYCALNKACLANLDWVTLWSGGIRVSSNAGEQYLTGNDDTLESMVQIELSATGSHWFSCLQQEILHLEKLAICLYTSVINYFKRLSTDKKCYQRYAQQASHLFWQCCEQHTQQLVQFCDKPKSMFLLHQQITGYVEHIFAQICPQNTARQLTVWAQSRPSFSHFMQ